MSRYLRSLFLISGLVLMLVSTQFLGQSSALSDNSIGISPALENLVVKPNQQSTSYKAVVTNNASNGFMITSSVTDFTSFGGSGSLEFINEKQTNSHSLAQSIIVDPLSFEIPAHQSQKVTITIANTQKLAGGGHYGAVLFQSSALNKTTESRVLFHQTLASLVFLTTSGEGTYGLKLQPIHSSIGWFKFPSSLNLLFTNTGNVQTIPRGYITMTSSYTKQASKTIINANSGLILPGTQRLLQTSLSSSGQPFWPGVYTVHVFYRYDGAANFSQIQSHIIYVNMLSLLVIILVFILVYFGLRKLYFSVHSQKFINN